jgi:hypothetical protein
VYFWRWFSRRSHRIVIVVRTCAPPLSQRSNLIVVSETRRRD